MKITKRGVDLGEQHFKCSVCETEFVANEDEYNLDRRPDGEENGKVQRLFLSVSCPRCGKYLEKMANQ